MLLISIKLGKSFNWLHVSTTVPSLYQKETYFNSIYFSIVFIFV